MITEYGFEFFALLVAFGVSAVIPGADFAMVLRQSIAHGRRSALFTSAGIATAILVHGAYTIFGLGLIISQSLLAFTIVKIVGAAYLLWLGISALRADPPRQPDVSDALPRDEMRPTTAFALGFLTNLLNPKAVLFFVALFTTLVSATTPMAIKAGYVVSMSIELFVWFALVSLFFALPAVRAKFFRLGRWFNRVTALTFIALAIRVAVARPN
ncbi:LysE family transporter [Pelagibacterium xiamenense]|uniref:LysE family transporter n=1 Tax=Pelagibacterium xiamenense TaxID=2901140 RepID=UPI001E4E531B|nr:LysE family transporter [Pelagibacterium xiamenense]MCD7058342.1 LysE family transporter [Pelagibacterium xiamenense]